MQIPKRFKLMGHTITVEYDPTLDYNEGASGSARYASQKIILQPTLKTHPIHPDRQEHVFLHELTHHCLRAIGENDLNDNEKFVDLFSGVLHQALTTMEFE